MSKKTEARLLTHASSQFFRHGYSNLSVDDLVQGIGMSKATLYRYFDSKYDLLEIVIEKLFQEIEADIHELLASKQEPEEKLRTFMTLMVERLNGIERPAIEDIKHSVPVLYEKFQNLRKHVIINHLVKVLEDGAEQGYFRKNIDQGVVAHIIFAAIESLTDMDYLAESRYRFSEVFDMVLTIVMYGNVADTAERK
ncbi:TetR/AcrR family transcriptional regulator [Paenibacillus alvei]|uniref:TetR/AcrR family transcriptional regulator n=1 Tax=Paenibacillus alvei TaxID=44250 RepID=A0ABT4E831_PAEAL|nr:TetR/AcrR family transcriptional regulator [Paenibacillus alvei]MCY9528531.1 TetR/AcrR family transcriptional regulator [Paenibacillus alvei]